MRLFIFVLTAAALLAQKASPPPPAVEDSGTTFRIDTRIVVCHTTVVDKTWAPGD